jgi:hypothetical protein
VLNGTMLTLPSPDNLWRWKKHPEPACKLCGRRNATQMHILANCPWVINQEKSECDRVEHRYTWRHNCVLNVIRGAIQSKLQASNKLSRHTLPELARNPVPFVKPHDHGVAAATGAAAAAAISSAGGGPKDKGLLSLARDWSADFDLPELHVPPAQPYRFPPEVAITESRPDCFIISRNERMCIAVELTAGTEENAAKQHQRKLERNERDLLPGLDPRWRFHFFAVEVGCRGFLSTSLAHAMYQLGFTHAEVGRVKSQCAYIARLCSYQIWANRHRKDFHPPRLGVQDGEDKR